MAETKVSLPLFIVAGAPKCGTTALWNYLDAHPGVCMAGMKEPRYFSDATGWFGRSEMSAGHLRSGNFSKGAEWYHSLFDLRPEHLLRGEASTQYFSVENTPRLIRREAPDAKVILMLRHPADRTFSHYWEERRLGIPLPPFDQLVAEDHCRYQYYRHVSSYRTNIERFYEVFPEDRVLILLIDDLRREPRAVLERVYRFLGLPDDFCPDQLNTEYNVQTTARWRSLQHFISLTKESTLSKKMPGGAKTLLKKGVGLIESINARAFRPPKLDGEARNRLLEELSGEVDFLENLLSRELEAWRK